MPRVNLKRWKKRPQRPSFVSRNFHNDNFSCLFHLLLRVCIPKKTHTTKMKAVNSGCWGCDKFDSWTFSKENYMKTLLIIWKKENLSERKRRTWLPIQKTSILEILKRKKCKKSILIMYLKYLLIIMFPILYRRCITTCISSEIITKDSFSSVCTSVLLFLPSLKKKCWTPD